MKYPEDIISDRRAHVFTSTFIGNVDCEIYLLKSDQLAWGVDEVTEILQILNPFESLQW